MTRFWSQSLFVKYLSFSVQIYCNKKEKSDIRLARVCIKINVANISFVKYAQNANRNFYDEKKNICTVWNCIRRKKRISINYYWNNTTEKKILFDVLYSICDYSSTKICHIYICVVRSSTKTWSSNLIYHLSSSQKEKKKKNTEWGIQIIRKREQQKNNNNINSGFIIILLFEKNSLFFFLDRILIYLFKLLLLYKDFFVCVW